MVLKFFQSKNRLQLKKKFKKSFPRHWTKVPLYEIWWYWVIRFINKLPENMDAMAHNTMYIVATSVTKNKTFQEIHTQSQSYSRRNELFRKNHTQSYSRKTIYLQSQGYFCEKKLPHFRKKNSARHRKFLACLRNGSRLLESTEHFAVCGFNEK